MVASLLERAIGTIHVPAHVCVKYFVDPHLSYTAVDIFGRQEPLQCRLKHQEGAYVPSSQRFTTAERPCHLKPLHRAATTFHGDFQMQVIHTL